MTQNPQAPDSPTPARCCPCGHDHPTDDGWTRRHFLEGAGGAAAIAGVALAGLSWQAMAQSQDGLDLPTAPPRKPLVVQPVFVYSVYHPRPQTSWRNWGGVETSADADQEMARIRSEIQALEKSADFPVRFQPLAPVQEVGQIGSIPDVDGCDALLVYACGGDTSHYNRIAELKKPTIIFVRHTSGPIYLWYEIISPRFLRQHTDQPVVAAITNSDVVVDSQDDILWRLRSLCGLRNTMGSRILAVGGPGAWSQPAGVVPDKVRQIWNLDIQTIPYEDLGKMIVDARADAQAVALARERTARYLAVAGTSLECELSFVENGFLLDMLFRQLMREADCRAITINHCMGTIMPLSETAACLSLSTLNDDGYLAFCESDFVVIPSGILLENIMCKPVFFCNPTFPHNGVITLAHCTAPRRMDGKKDEPVRIMTHYESDYGAAPKVDMRIGERLTMIIPDFAAERWVGLMGTIEENPFLPICRSQINVRFTCDSHQLADNMQGFHWMVGYGDYRKETRYALARTSIGWDELG